MSTPLDNLRRIEQLEARLAEQERLIRAILGRQERWTGKRWLFLAKTVAGVDGQGQPLTYPAGGNTFHITFLDRAFTPVPGSTAVTDHPRSAEQQATARTVDGRYVGEGTVVEVFPAPVRPGTDGTVRWWIPAGAGFRLAALRGQLNPPTGSGLSQRGSAQARELTFNSTTGALEWLGGYFSVVDLFLNPGDNPLPKDTLFVVKSLAGQTNVLTEPYCDPKLDLPVDELEP